MKPMKIIKFLPFYGLSILPMPVLYLLSDLSFFLIYYLFGYRKKVVRDNLKKAFPAKNEKEIHQIGTDFYRHFCDIIFESIKRLTISPKAVKKRLKIQNPVLIEKYLNERRSILLYTAHQGNWEWLIFLPLFFPCPSNTFYRPLKNKYFNELSMIMRERFGVHCIETDKGYRTVISDQQNHAVTMNCVIGDQSPTLRSPMYWCQFMNRKTAFYVGADKIAKRTDQVVLFPSFKKIKRGYYELEFQVIEDQPKQRENYAIVENYAARLENAINRAPEMWLWSHRRWKLTS
jgi:KDO2-lipid IV(A) lauroyltransferase